MINPPPVLPEEPTAVTPHGGFCGGKKPAMVRYPTKPTSGSGRGDQGNPVPYRHRVSLHMAVCPGEGRLTEPTAAAQPRRRQQVFMLRSDIGRYRTPGR